MSNGSMQFLGRQLNIMANAMSELVEKMALMVQQQDQMIDKYSLASDVIQEEKTLEPPMYYISTSPYQIKSFLNGTIRVKLKISEVAVGKNISINLNGVLHSSKNYIAGVYIYDFDVAVAEGDSIGIMTNNNGTLLEKISIGYDLIPKPSMAL